jgi:hypothetical protein
MAPDPGYSRMKLQKRVDLIVDALCYLYDDLFAHSMISLVKKNLSKHKFYPANVLKQMDHKGGALSYEGVEIMRSVGGPQLCHLLFGVSSEVCSRG